MPEYTIGSLQKGLRVLVVLCERFEQGRGNPIRLRDLAHYLDIPASQLIRYLQTLENSGFAVRVDDRWMPGTALVAMGYQVIMTLLVYQKTKITEELANKEGTVDG